MLISVEAVAARILGSRVWCSLPLELTGGHPHVGVRLQHVRSSVVSFGQLPRIVLLLVNDF